MFQNQTTTEKFEQFIFEKISEFLLNLTEDSLAVPMLPLAIYEKIFKQLGYLDQEDFESNGWQVDFSNSFEKNESIIILTGSLYYGNFKLVKST